MLSSHAGLEASHCAGAAVGIWIWRVGRCAASCYTAAPCFLQWAQGEARSGDTCSRSCYQRSLNSVCLAGTQIWQVPAASGCASCEMQQALSLGLTVDVGTPVVVAHSLQAAATNLGTWPATSTSHTHHCYTAAQPKPGRVSVTRQPQLPPTGHPAAAAAAPKPAFQRSASRSLGPAVAAGQAAKSAAARLAAEPAVERSAASLPSAKGDWGAAVSPFAALSLGPSETANNGEATALPWPTCHAALSALDCTEQSTFQSCLLLVVHVCPRCVCVCATFHPDC